MGNKIPVPDERMQKVMDMLKMDKKSLAKLWKVFRKYDQDNGGTIDIEEFYKLIEEERTVFGDSIFELCDIESCGALDFSDFATVLSTYCMFGRTDILKFCFFVFDKDKNGFIEHDELFALVEMLHGNQPNANCKLALDKFDTNSDGKIDFDEFKALNAKFPMLLFPAFRIQDSMMNNTLGESWWKKRKIMLEGERSRKESMDSKLKMKELERQRKQNRRILKRRMGFKYYVFFWRRRKVLAQIAAEEALRKEKRQRKQQKKEEEMRKLEKKKSLAKLFSAQDDGIVTKESKHKKKHKKHKSHSKIHADIEEKEARHHDHETTGKLMVVGSIFPRD